MAVEKTAIKLPADKYQCIGAQDFADNPELHISEVREFAKTYEMTYGDAVEYLIEPDEESSADAIEDYLERRGFVLESTRANQSTPTPQVFNNEADSEAATEWVKDEYFNFIHNDRFWTVGVNPVSFAGGNTRGGLTDVMNRGEVGMVDPTYLAVGDIELADIIGRRIPIQGNKYIAPHVTKPKNYKLTGIAELGDIPVWKMTTGETPVKTLKAGYGHIISYEMLRTDGDFTMEALAEFSRMLAFLTLQEVINRGIKLVADGATAYAPSAALNKQEYIKLVGQRKTGTSYNTIIGTLEFMADYLGVDLSYASANTVAGVGARSLIEMLVGGQRLGIRDHTEISNFTQATKKAVMFDRRFCLEYVFGRNSDVEEEDRNPSNQSISFFNTFDFAFKTTEYFTDTNPILATLT